MKHPLTQLLTLLTFAMAMDTADAQFNYDESKVPQYTLPDPLVRQNGKPVKSSRAWTRKRRAEVLELFRTHMYGRAPEPTKDVRFTVLNETKDALDGLATRKEIRVAFTGDPKPDDVQFMVLLYIPNNVNGPAPAFLGLNFRGNQTIHADPAITLSTHWSQPEKGKPSKRTTADPATRGQSTRWPVEMILKRGYALATTYYGDIEPDFGTGWPQGVRGLYKVDGSRAKLDRSDPEPSVGAPPWSKPDGWSAIGAWAWGLSRILDYLETDDAINHEQVALLGHSRLGKTSLWAGARDERFAIVISNNSGCGGAALSRRRFGETVQRINQSFPHWFCTNFKQYNGKEDELPLDQHMLVALMAPRPVYVASAVEDRWADPRGEFLAAKHAEPVYTLLGKPGIGVDDQPAVDNPVGNTIGYHVRTGKHDVTDYDWEQYMNFADRHFGRQ